MMRTSLTHPLIIAEIPIGDRGGAIGVTFAPGKYQVAAMTGAWARDLEQDMLAIRQWGAAHLISLLEPLEFSELQIEKLPEVAAGRGISWYPLPITDGSAPDQRFLQGWPVLSAGLIRGLHSGQRVVIHCKGGLGRAGTVAAMLLLQSETAQTAQDAMRMVRFARPGAIETAAQEEFLECWWAQCRRSNSRS
ncbi:protein tyrosine phosphatase [Stenotrophomonas sp. Nf1]|nr:protein tyrosine phosphatase [Stenotrophomonas sp. Nf1]PTA82506.1 protein tyrosine phosphatase [Stenotrophomonas sp. Nf4]